MKINLRKTIFFIALRVYGSKIPQYLREMERWGKLDTVELDKIQKKKLEKLLLHAYKNNAYYRKILKDKKVIVKNQVNLKNFSKLPILDKETIRKEGKKLYSRGCEKRKSYENTSGGTSGEPVVLLQDKIYRDWNFATKILVNYRLKKKIGDREIKLWGSERDIFNESKSIKDQLVNLLYNRKLLNAFKMSPQNMASYVKEINSFKPLSIWSYVESIFELAKFIDQNKLEIHSPEFIMTTAGVLTEELRVYIEKIFKTKVVNQYGSREAGIIASEDFSQNGLRIFPWLHYLEIKNGKLLITSLNNYSMPLIRYEIGDLAEFKIIDNEKRIKRIYGRHSNHFILADGSLIHGEFFAHLFYFQNWLRKFRIEQEGFDEINCKIVLANQNIRPNQNTLVEIENKIKMTMGNSCKINWHFVKNIKTSKSGKFIYTESKIKQ